MLQNFNSLITGQASWMRLKRTPLALKIQIIKCICFVWDRGEQPLEF